MKMRLWLLGTMGIVVGAVAENVVFFSIASTAETRIVSFAAPGELAWTNANVTADARPAWSFWPDGYWSTNFDFTWLPPSGAVWRVQCPVPAEPSGFEFCRHNLWLIQASKDRYAALYGFAPVSFFDLLSVGPLTDIPVCPSNGYYSMGFPGADPACSFIGHKL